MASLSNDLEGLNLKELGAIPKSLSTSHVPPTPSTPGSRTRRNRRNRQNRRHTNEGVKSSPSSTSLPSAICKVEEKRVPDVVPPLEQFEPDESDLGDIKEIQEPEMKLTAQIVDSHAEAGAVKSTGKKPSRRRKGKRKKENCSGEVVGGKGKGKAKNANKENIFFEGREFPSSSDNDDSDLEGSSHHVPPDEPKYIWRNVTKNGAIKKCILVDGMMDGGRPKPGDAVLVKTQGKLKDGTIIDDEPSMVFNIGDYEVIEGLDLAVQSMYKNELSIISVKPELAYGTLGRNKAPSGKLEEVPANSRITYLFGLLHFEKAKDIKTMTWAQRRKCGQSKMRLANWWYQRKEYPVAVKCYKKALQYYNDIPTNQECSSPEEYKELLQLMEERLRVMRQVANIFKRIANLIQSGQIET